jgi:hypothetical protein
MAKRKRELIFTPANNARLVATRCNGCNWHASVEYSSNQTAGEAAQAAFDAHHCEAYPLHEDVNQAAARIVKETTDKH